MHERGIATVAEEVQSMEDHRNGNHLHSTRNSFVDEPNIFEV